MLIPKYEYNLHFVYNHNLFLTVTERTERMNLPVHDIVYVFTCPWYCLCIYLSMILSMFYLPVHDIVYVGYQSSIQAVDLTLGRIRSLLRHVNHI